MCHYVDSYEEKKLGIKVNDVHVFCCFPSKLSRVVQEEARDQLKLNWGKSSKPICRGLTIDELSSVNFSKMDLSRAFDEKVKLPDHFNEKLQAFQNRLREDLKKENQAL